ncbi:hypothetical protein FACS1894200_03830 [Spirochaetia bacterium]|nr:hypothetical protein FACS1894200_03830 [Spirochaetia bacterium]
MNFEKQARRLEQAALVGLLLLTLMAGACSTSPGDGGFPPPPPPPPPPVVTGVPLGKIAILPFTGGSVDEQEGIAEMLSFTKEIMRNFSVIPRTSIIDVVKQEHTFARSGITDADTIVRMGKQLGAQYVIAGSITSLGSKNLLIVSIIKIEAIRQVAGDYIVYDSLDVLNTNETLLRTMGANLVKLARGVNESLDNLALPPVEFTDGANKQEGDTLAQLLAIHLLRNGKYAVYPRTGNLDQVRDEYKKQWTDGNTETGEKAKLGKAVNPRLALSIKSRKIGSSTRFNAAIIDLEYGNTLKGESEQYAGLSDGMNTMEVIAKKLSADGVSN